MNIEIEILSNIVNSGDIREAKSVGINSDLFRTSMGQNVWRWLLIESESADTFGELPDSTRLKRRFPDFNYSPTNNSLKALYREAKDIYTTKDTHDLIDSLQSMMEEDYDPKTVIMEAIDKFKELQASSISTDGSYLHDSASTLRDRYELRKANDGVTGLHFPYQCLNKMTGGMSPGDLVYIYGRPGTMKSWLLCVFADYLVKTHNKRVMLYTKEIDDDTLKERVASIHVGLDYGSFRDGSLSVEDEQRFFDYLAELNSRNKNPAKDTKGGTFVVTDKGCKVPRTVEKLMVIAEKIQPDIIFIDGFYLLNPGSLLAKSSAPDKIKSISGKLKEYAQQLGIPIVCTTQANREGKDSFAIGDTADAAFSDAISQDANLMLRTFKAPNPLKHGGNRLLIVPKKVREGGKDGTPQAFTIHANPSYDWSLDEYPACVDTFRAEMDGNDIAAGRKQGEKSAPFAIKKRKKGHFRE